jgi:hypothetical protein
VAHPVLDLLDGKTAAQQVAAAGVLEGVAVAQRSRPAGESAIAFDEDVESLAADRTSFGGWKEGARRGSAKLDPVFQGARLLVIQRVPAGTGAVHAVHHEVSGLRRIILEIEQADFGGSEAGVVHDAKDGLVASRVNDAEEVR